MAIYKYLGYGVTNSKGIAKLDHDKNGDPITHSYTGTGAGELDIIASLDNPSTISDSSIQSEIYSLYDCIILDTGITGTATDLFTNMTDVYDRTSNGTTVTYTNTGATAYQSKTSNVPIEGKLNIDFELIECTNCQIQTGRYETGKSTEYQQATITGTGKVHIEILPNGTYIYLNGNLISQDIAETNMGECAFFFRCIVGKSISFKYRNFMIY